MKKSGYSILILLLLVSCTQQQPNNPDPSQTTPSPVTTAPPVVNQEFEEANILQFTFEKVDTKGKIETRNPVYEIQITNHSTHKVKEISLNFDGYYYLEYYREIQPNETKTIYRALSLPQGQIIDLSSDLATYQYYEDTKTRKVVDLVAKSVSTYTEVSSEQITDVIPMVPNNGVTLYTWKQNGTWKFDYVLGLEATETDQDTGYYMPYSVFEAVNESYMETRSRFFVFRNLNGLITKEMKDYITAQLQYSSAIYTFDDDKKKIDQLAQKHGLMNTVGIYPKGQYGCEYTYCAVVFSEHSNIYQFPDGYLDKIGDRALSAKDVAGVIKKLSYPEVMIHGLYDELKDQAHRELLELFRKEEIYSIVMDNYKPIGADKPVIYLYPPEEKTIEVSLDYKGTLRTTYPLYDGRWTVKAKPDGSLINLKDQKEYSYLFWEGIGPAFYPMDRGFVVAKENLIPFFQENLAKMGLLAKEYNEFIVYWLPLMQEYPYYQIAFQEQAYEEIAKLNIKPEPETIIRVFMTFKGLEKPIDLPAQSLPQKQRSGFTVVEWGGTELTK